MYNRTSNRNLIAENFKCSNEHPWLLHFLIQQRRRKKKQVRMLSIVVTASVEDSYHDEWCPHLVQLFGLCSSHSWSTVTLSKGGRSWSKYLTECSPVQSYQVLEGSCSWPHMVAVNNSNKVWYVLIFWTIWYSQQ